MQTVAMETDDDDDDDKFPLQYIVLEARAGIVLSWRQQA